MTNWDIRSEHRPPPRWYYDPLLAEEIRHQIRSMHRAGIGTHAIARRIGISSRTVTRTIHHQLPSENRARPHH